MNAGDYISVIAVLIAAAALLYSKRADTHASAAVVQSRESNRLAAEANQIATKALGIEEARDRANSIAARTASVTAKVYHKPPISTGELIITNAGPGSAREVKVFLDRVPLAQHPLFAPTSHSGDPFALQPAASQGFLLRMGMGAAVSHVRLEWVDATGGPGRWESPL